MHCHRHEGQSQDCQGRHLCHRRRLEGHAGSGLKKKGRSYQDT